jgi:exopolysaccharide biosynthesis protein
MESSAGGFLATWFLPDEVIEQIIKENTIMPTNDVTDPEMIVVSIGRGLASSESGEEIDSSESEAPEFVDNFNEQGVYIIDIVRKNFKGKLLVVANPARISVGTPLHGYGEDRGGETVISMAERTNSLAAVNGGGFWDGDGHGNGGVPTGRYGAGIVISNGNLLWGNLQTTYEVIGLNSDGVLILGNMTGQQALESGIRDAVNFGPLLIVNGIEQRVAGDGGLNPRTAIGQRQDGVILILVIDGRQPHSLGASYDDMIQLFLEYGAVNAANLDGGSSTYMVYDNEIITRRSSLWNPRQMATSILVSRLDTGRNG